MTSYRKTWISRLLTVCLAAASGGCAAAGRPSRDLDKPLNADLAERRPEREKPIGFVSGAELREEFLRFAAAPVAIALIPILLIREFIDPIRC